MCCRFVLILFAHATRVVHVDVSSIGSSRVWMRACRVFGQTNQPIRNLMRNTDIYTLFSLALGSL